MGKRRKKEHFRRGYMNVGNEIYCRSKDLDYDLKKNSVRATRRMVFKNPVQMWEGSEGLVCWCFPLIPKC